MRRLSTLLALILASAACSSGVATTVGGRAFVKVVAADRGTGEQVLLLYENVARRPGPFQVIRFRTPAAAAAPR